VYTVEPIANAASYVWTIPAEANLISGAGTDSIVVDYSRVAESGFISVYGMNACGQGSLSSLEITVNLLPATPVISRLGNTLTSSAPEGNQWYMDGAIIDGATAQSYEVTATGIYWTTVTLEGCSSDTSNNIEVLFEGITNVTSAKIELYPVPSNGLFMADIAWPSAANFNIRIYNTIGSLVFEKKDVEIKGIANVVFDIRTVPLGMYTVLFTNGTNRIIRKMIINRD
jgi:hypothetical protein